MALLSLKDIGKIYVSEGNVSVGIRGVNLTFERGEFVAVTGKSGSGKSTLLNVISGMDTYEEGEMYVDGEPTSHFLQPEWEKYREDYISFIFQDYNIIESFTVLQNVELALMNIDDRKERRKRALELIDRVGLSSHIKHKGSKLSGGQKQRTVIARALAKDSPIILADEPTGNLDSVSSKEIIELLKEVSKDKLLIVVTHNFEQVEDHATRHIRIFDGEVESDQRLSNEQNVVQNDKKSIKTRAKGRDIKNGISLGKAIFTSKPRLSLFLCILLFLGTLGIATITSSSSDMMIFFDKNYMFEHIDGRVVTVKRDGSVPTEEEIKALAEKHGAEAYIRYDHLLDDGGGMSLRAPHLNDYKYFCADFVYGVDYGADIIGSYPEKENEVFMYLPIYYQDVFGKNEIKNDHIFLSDLRLEISGIKYYYDNNLSPQCLLTKDGFDTVTLLSFVLVNNYPTASLTATNKQGEQTVLSDGGLMIIPSFELKGEQIYYPAKIENGFSPSLTLNFSYYKHDYYSFDSTSFSQSFSKTFGAESFVDASSVNIEHSDKNTVYISTDALKSVANSVLSDSYTQFSLFFENDQKAENAAVEISNQEYIAVPSTTTYTPELIEVILQIIMAFAGVFVWILTVVFLSFFVYLCSSRTLLAFKNDMAIMRSMGISVKVIKIGMYVRMLISLMPAYLLTVIAAILVFTSPVLNEFFMYLYPWQFALIFLGMLLLTVRTTHKQVKKLFGQSVKKSLKGGQAE